MSREEKLLKEREELMKKFALLLHEIETGQIKVRK